MIALRRATAHSMEEVKPLIQRLRPLDTGGIRFKQNHKQATRKCVILKGLTLSAAMYSTYPACGRKAGDGGFIWNQKGLQ